jgi:guanylate kinase
MESEKLRQKGLLVVVSAPSGCGKGTILAEIMKSDENYFSVSATTRAPRPGEVDGVNYHFLSREEFESRIAEERMLEYAEYCGNYYGTPADEVEKQRRAGKNVFLEIEVQGAMQIRKKCPDAVFIFIVPPSVETLAERLRGRGTETEEVIAKRVAEARNELLRAPDYDYIIVNDDLDEAIDDLRTVLRAEKMKTENSKEILSEVIGK